MTRSLAATALCAATILLAAGVSMPAQTDDKVEKVEKKEPKRPSLSLKATPGTGMVPIRVSANPHNKRYLETKRTRLGHLI